MFLRAGTQGLTHVSRLRNISGVLEASLLLDTFLLAKTLGKNHHEFDLNGCHRFRCPLLPRVKAALSQLGIQKEYLARIVTNRFLDGDACLLILIGIAENKREDGLMCVDRIL